MSSRATFRCRHILLCLLLAVSVLAPASVPAAPATAPADAGGKRISRVVVTGNERTSANRILGQMRLREGSVYSSEAVDEDLKRIYALGEFDNVVVRPTEEGGRLVLEVKVTERPVLGSVEFVGNKHFSNKDLAETVGVAAGRLVDQHRIVTGSRSIEEKYRAAGYLFAKATLDQALLDRERIARYTITEGPLVRLAKIVFVGNHSIPSRELRGKTETWTWYPLLNTGQYNEELMQRDLMTIRNYYIEQGFLDVRVDREMQFNTDRTRLTVRIIIDEGPRYHVRSVALEGVERFNRGLLRKQMELQPGTPYTSTEVRHDVKLIQDTYGEIGYIDAFVQPVTDFGEQPGIVDVTMRVEEGKAVRIGQIRIEGNQITKDRVVRRDLKVYPGEPVNTVQIEKARRRLDGLGIFKPGSVQVTTVATADPTVRDVVVRVAETETANLILGAGISSNSGVIGNLSFVQRNFDLTGWPRSADELARGEAFRGGGQLFQIVLEPGTELQRYRIDFREPSLFDTGVSLSTSGFYFDRERDHYDERRIGGSLGFGKEIREDLHAFINFRYENIGIRNLDTLIPQDLRDVAGTSALTSIEVGLIKDTTDSYFFPTEGYRVRGSVEQAGAMGGDYTFTKFQIDARKYWTVTRDVLDRRSVLSLKGQVGYIASDAPIFERFYVGGIGSIRGFEYRGVGPREFDTPLGGDFLALASAEYSFPIVEKTLTGVLFIDTGTVSRQVSLSTWRVSVGAGIRFTVPLLGPVPFAFDFGFPLLKDDEDETEVFSFSIGTTF